MGQQAYRDEAQAQRKYEKIYILGGGNKVSVNILTDSIDQSDETKASR